MAYILSIDTSTSSASIFLSENGNLIGSAINNNQQDHATWINVAIQQLLTDASVSLHQLNAIAVSEGPGSYTGLRVAMATAKGLCYALNVPLICESTLRIMAASAIKTKVSGENGLLVPMIDARRMEVFTAIYDLNLTSIQNPVAMILDSESFKEYLSSNVLIFFGNGADKWQRICEHSNARFEKTEIDGIAFTTLTYQKFLRGEFTTLAYAEPVYLKEYYIHPK